jgi:nucleoside-diphosphate-sugar epimerase
LATILVTGSTGFIAGKLIDRLKDRHTVFGTSRSASTAPQSRLDYTSFEDLRKLDGEKIDIVVHLASEIGGCSEEAAISTNVAGTRRMLRYFLDHGVRRFILASSIAAPGCLSTKFRPVALPIAPNHPCMADDAYGLSKFLIEQLCHYCARNFAAAEFVLLR